MAEISNSLAVREATALDPKGGDTFTSVLLVRRTTSKTAKNGNAFLSVELGDKTGTFGITVFSDAAHFDLFKAARDGLIVRIEAKVDYFQDRFSPRLQRAEEITPDQLVNSPLMANLVETAPEDP